MIGRDEIVRKLRETLPDIQRRYPVRRLALFESSARGEATETSDVDLLVEFDTPIGFFDFMRLETSLSEVLHSKVDLVSVKALKPVMRDEVLNQAVYV